MNGRLLLLATIAAEFTILGVLPTMVFNAPYAATLSQFGGVAVSQPAAWVFPPGAGHGPAKKTCVPETSGA